MGWLDKAKIAAADMTDKLAVVGTKIPSVAQVTISVAGVTVTVQPVPAPHSVCGSCGK